MNLKAIIYILGWILKIEGAFMLFPALVGIIYKETQGLAFLITALICIFTGILITHKKPKNTTLFAREGFIITSATWIIMSFFGALPFVINGDIPHFTNALFEAVSGFTTTGASIIDDLESVSHASLFWRSFTHWIGGMGVLVFLLAIVPMTDGTPMHIMRAESPGPSVDKLLPKLKQTAFVLYAIYFLLTITEFILLILGKMPLFDAITLTLGTAGTGGFGIKSDSIASYTPYQQWIIGIFMMLFGVNFGFYFLLLAKKFRQAFSFEEVRNYIFIIICATTIIMLSFIGGDYLNDMTFTEKLRHSFFQVASIITTTGYSTLDYDILWPELAKVVIVIIMFIGACAGSTGGGIKISRITILYKSIKKEITLFFHPKRIVTLKNEKKPVAHETIRSINVFIMAYTMIYAVSVLLISIDNFDFTTNFTAVAATLNNIGPGLNQAGPTESFSTFSGFSKYVMIFDMLAGRLEIFPMLILLSKEFWVNVFTPTKSAKVIKHTYRKENETL